LIYNDDKGIVRAVRNLPGIEVARVDSLNILQLAPGGHLGRFIIWTKTAFVKLNQIWGNLKSGTSQKEGYVLPRPLLTNSDITRIINSDEVQSKVHPAVKVVRRSRLHKNPLKNLGVAVRLNPYTLTARRSELLAEERHKKARAAKLEAARKKLPVEKTAAEKANAVKQNKRDKLKAVHYKRIVDDSLYEVKPAPVVVKKVVEQKEGQPPKKLLRAPPSKIKKEKEVVEEEPKKEEKKPAAAAKKGGKEEEKKEEKKDEKAAKGGKKK